MTSAFLSYFFMRAIKSAKLMAFCREQGVEFPEVTALALRMVRPRQGEVAQRRQGELHPAWRRDRVEFREGLPAGSLPPPVGRGFLTQDL